MRHLVLGVHADINAVHTGVTPLMCAAIGGSYPCAKQILLWPGIKVNWSQDGKSALWYAAAHSSSNVAELLLRQDDIEVNVQDAKKQRTSLAIAATQNHIQIVRCLLADSRTKVNIPDIYGQTPLHRAIEAGHSELLYYCSQAVGLTLPAVTPGDWLLFIMPQKPVSIESPAAC
jgi:ankyrin repeat protein